MSAKKQLYQDLALQAQSLMSGESNLIANLANLSALLFTNLPDVNWAGFYLYDGNELVLGPFQGQPACIRIPMNKGVCGTAAFIGETLVVKDVHAFDGHIACDAASNSEIVVPIFANNELIGVLDIDSPSLSRFDDVDKEGTLLLVDILTKACFN